MEEVMDKEEICYEWAEYNLPVQPDDVEESPWCDGCRYTYYGTLKELEKIYDKVENIVSCVLPEDNPDDPTNHMDCDKCLFE